MKNISIAKFKYSLSDELHVLFTNAKENGIWNTEYTNKRKLQKIGWHIYYKEQATQQQQAIRLTGRYKKHKQN